MQPHDDDDGFLHSFHTGLYTSVAMTVGMVAWTLSYVFRVANKVCTFVRMENRATSSIHPWIINNDTCLCVCCDLTGYDLCSSVKELRRCCLGQAIRRTTGVYVCTSCHCHFSFPSSSSHAYPIYVSVWLITQDDEVEALLEEVESESSKNKR